MLAGGHTFSNYETYDARTTPVGRLLEYEGFEKIELSFVPWMKKIEKHEDWVQDEVYTRVRLALHLFIRYVSDITIHFRDAHEWKGPEMFIVIAEHILRLSMRVYKNTNAPSLTWIQKGSSLSQTWMPPDISPLFANNRWKLIDTNGVVP